MPPVAAAASVVKSSMIRTSPPLRCIPFGSREFGDKQKPANTRVGVLPLVQPSLRIALQHSVGLRGTQTLYCPVLGDNLSSATTRTTTLLSGEWGDGDGELLKLQAAVRPCCCRSPKALPHSIQPTSNFLQGPA
jgi:hypothetical protein